MEMVKARWYAVLDMHKDTMSVALMERYAPEPELVKPNRPANLRRLLGS